MTANDNLKNTKNTEELTNEKAELIADILKGTKFNSKHEEPNDSEKEIKQQKNKTQQIIKNANNKFLIDVLSPEIQNNEKKKRDHKDALMIAMAIFLSIQFVILFIVVGYTLWSVVSCHKNNNPFDNSTIQLLFGFVGVYMTSVVVELIAILKYIVTKVFDTSIASLVEIFKDKQ